MADKYYTERSKNNLKALKEIKSSLPYFCEEYFVGIENNSSTLTRLNYAYDLRIFFYFLVTKKLKNKAIDELTLKDIEQVTATDIEAFLSFLTLYEFMDKEHACSERAKARKLSTVRAMFKYFYNKGKIETNNASKVSMPKIHDKEIIRLEVDEIVRLINTAESGEGLTDRQRAYNKRYAVRDVAIITLFLGTGIRISELVGLDNDDIDFSVNAFKVIRKGGNQTVLYFSDEVASALKAYIEQKNANIDIPFGEKALFLSVNGKTYRRIATRSVENIIKKYSKIAAPLKKISPHKLRSTYGTQLYRETHDIYVVADVLGHRDVNTTKRHYAAISEDLRRDAASKVKLREQEIPSADNARDFEQNTSAARGNTAATGALDNADADKK